ncbi:hypothetical protein IWQ60_010114 [Tieghemiomyces parasiticus]|uniref:JmjC domain-containing protein n=1 Tax=Tieghemiomyces parasiticus TaxID=78921 RepID=A0A9W8DK29_9FUNG|nr:hypothetical protein IWQ60_010114 [Tieghemiomyces parasiticus]
MRLADSTPTPTTSRPSPTEESVTQRSQYAVESLIDYARAQIYSVKYDQVDRTWLILFSDASIMKALMIALVSPLALVDVLHAELDTAAERLPGTSTNWDLTRVAATIGVLDTALIMTSGPGGRAAVIHSLIDELTATYNQWDTSCELFAQYRHLEPRLPATVVGLVSADRTVPIWACPTVLDFSDYIRACKTPGPQPRVITGAIDHWPALTTRPWSDLNYLYRAVGPARLVPVEVGRDYTRWDWTQRLVTFAELLEKYVLPPRSGPPILTTTGSSEAEVGYLAQHNLLAQVPVLRNDLSVPDYCYSASYIDSPGGSEDPSGPSDPLVNAWFGPAGTVSPLHHDPYHNLLAQVVGYKYIRLYSPDETSNLYPFPSGESLMTNTSEVDVEQPDLNRYPRFRKARYVECILGPGQLLYIPPYWWHYVRSLTTSFSISFWF